MVRVRLAAHASAQRPLLTSYLIGLLRLQVGAIIQLPWAMVVMQPWLRERRLSLGAAAQGQYYLFGVNFGASPPSDPHFPRPIRPEPPSSPPCSALTATYMCPAGTANGAGTVANGGAGTARLAGIAATTAAAAAALSGRAGDAFSSILRPSHFGPGCRTYGVGQSTAVGRLGRLGRRWAARARPGGG
jgi:hypothetical protein